MADTETLAGQGVPALTVTAVSKTFGLATVLSNASLELVPGEVHALVGENGSGKSTLVKILAGYHTPDPGGEVLVAGEPLSFGQPKASDDLGLRFVHQDLGLVNDLDTIDNLSLSPGYKVRALSPVNRKKERQAAEDALGRLGYEIDVRRLVGTLTASERTAIAIARALSPRRSESRLLVLDEPTANLPAPEVERLFALLNRVSDSGVAILFISHHFTEVFELAHRATVLRNGSIVATRNVSDLDEDGLIELMMGRRLELAARSDAVRTASAERSLELVGVSGRTIALLDLDVAPGEIVGVAGITGSGREELASLVGGDLDRQGTVTIDGTLLTPARPDRLIALGGAFVPASRQRNALLHGHTVKENATISKLRPFFSRGIWNTRKEAAEVDTLMTELDVRPKKPQADISTLSGGNQQKVMIARALRLSPRVLVVDEPTQGVDVGAQAEIHRIIREQAAAGAAVLICSSSNEELAEVSDRVIVLSNGRISATFTAPLDPDLLTASMLATTKEAS